MRQSSPERRAPKRGFTLVELLVVIAIIGTLVALLLPAVQSARESGRRATCTNNMRQLTLAMTNFDASQSQLPGYINDLENPRSDKDSIGQYEQARQASWVVMTFPYIEQNTLWDNWSDVTTTLSNTNVVELEMLECPSNAPEIPGNPWCSYVANSGQMLEGSNYAQNAANGVFMDRSVNLNALGSSSQADGREGTKAPKMSINYISSNDGTSNTMMFSESLYSFYWTYTDYTSSSSPETPVANSQDKGSVFIDDPRWFGFVWTNSDGNYYKINGLPEDSDAAAIAFMGEKGNVHAFPSSRHPGGVVAAFCDGRVIFLLDTIDPTIYGQIMTSNSRRSNFAPNGVADRKLPPVSDDAF